MAFDKRESACLRVPDITTMRELRRVTWVGLLANLFLSSLKFVGGIFGASQAVVADAVHSLSDSTTDVAILIGIRYWSKPPDEDHPYGHRRIETLVTITIGLLLVGVAAGLAYNALVNLQEKHSSGPNWIAFVAAAVSIVCKEFLYHWTVAAGRRHKSPAVIANAWHHRSDALSSIPVAMAVLGAALYPAWIFLDHVGAVVVTIFILQAAWKIMWPALKEIVDAGASERDCEQIKTVALGVEGVKDVHAIRARYLGSGLQADLHILVDGDKTVREGHDLSEKVKELLLANGPDVVDVVVHLEPAEEIMNDEL
jgi:cation diffusion facilitator family transporter